MSPSRPAPLAIPVLAALLAGCQAPPPPAVTPAPSSPAAAPVQTPAAPPRTVDGWIGQWTGPEGTFLRIEPADAAGTYAITIRDLDQEHRYTGHADGERIGFERDGEQAAISASDGEGTGMKWLADKRDCLVIAPGEGYCRD